MPREARAMHAKAREIRANPARHATDERAIRGERMHAPPLLGDPPSPYTRHASLHGAGRSRAAAPRAGAMLDWDDLRYFLAVARHGNLSAAARALKVTQPTVGRRIEAFERRLGAKLFQRSPSGFALSAAGESVL